MAEARTEQSGQESSHELDKSKLTSQLAESTDLLAEEKKTCEELKLQCSQYEAKIAEQDHLQNMLTKKFEEWEKVFKQELEKAREKTEFYRQQMDEDQQTMNDKIAQQEDEIKDLKLKLTSKDVELASGEL